MIYHKRTTGWRCVIDPETRVISYEKFTVKRLWCFSFVAEGLTLKVEALPLWEHGRFLAVERETGYNIIPWDLKIRSEEALEALEINQEFLNRLAKVFVPGEYYKSYKKQLQAYLERLNNVEKVPKT